jgi:NADH-quinone oxidoreductase subunit L
MAYHEFSAQDFLVLSPLLIPLLSFLIASLISERYSWAVALVCSFIMMGGFIFATIVLIGQWNNPAVIISMKWFSVGEAVFSANLAVTESSLLMLFVVACISFMVHLFSIGYMAGDVHARRYFSILGLFTFAMQGIVLADSLLLIFLFWELVGFSSYLLIGHYMEKPAAARASKKAFIMNRLGDAGFLIGILIIWLHTGTLDLAAIGQVTADGWKTAASLCIFCGVIGKSAQFPLFTWLPDAMEGPTPVSALIHAATMVAAGVYLLARTFPLFSATSLEIVAIVGAITAITGALAALGQFDIKKILAFSTVSQLGLMIMVIGAGAAQPALLHLYTHAFFKGCLFLCAGSFIHALHLAQRQADEHFDVQDIRNLGGLAKSLPLTTLCFCISGASLAGIPFFSGFLSKEAIVSDLWNLQSTLSTIVLVTAILVSVLTVLYTFRLVWFTCFAKAGKPAKLTVPKAPLVMRIPMVILAAGSCWLSVSWNPFDSSGWFFTTDRNPFSLLITIASTAVIGLALLLSWMVFRSGRIRSTDVLLNAFYLDSAYEKAVRQTIMPLSRVSSYVDKNVIDKVIHLNAFGYVTLAHVIQWIDKYIIDGIVTLATRIVYFIGSIVRKFQRGKIQLYIFWALFAIIIFLIWGLN